MKKILALTSLVFALSVGATAMAADDTDVTNVASGVDYTTNAATSFSTVLVQGPGATPDIVYVDQAEETFTTGLQLMLKPNLADGTYTIKFGGAGQTAASQTFTLTTNSGGSTTDTVVADMTTAATTNNGDGTTNIAFSATVDRDVDAVEFTVTKGGDTKTGVLDLKTPLTISGTNAECAVLVSNIPDGYTVTAKLVKKATSNS